ncbi:MAG TPA: hypothetical protein VFP91_13070 [Vicinamibacterales bacterium]|nr:hypothetical protein [Vicinamibacterales bacterium]
MAGPLSIVGAGDVVANRLLPALLDSHSLPSPADIVVFTIDASDSLLSQLAAAGVDVHVRDEARIVDEVIARGAPVVIATPSDAHLRYLYAIAPAHIRCAVEKPLTSVATEVDELERRTPDLASTFFALSYYGLEKALPLAFFLNPRREFDPFLEYDGTTPLDELRTKLGALRSVRIDLLEGPERSPTGVRRAWTEAGGGLAFETLIHPLILARKFARYVHAPWREFLPSIRQGRFAQAAVGGSITFLRLDGALDGVEVTLTAGKYVQPPSLRRGGVAVFDGGTMRFDFDEMAATITTSAGRCGHLRVRSRYAGKYRVQTALMLQFFAAGWPPGSERFDDLFDQMDVLTWLHDRRLDEGASFEYGTDQSALVAALA